MGKEEYEQKNETSASNKKAPHNIEVSSTGYGYIPLNANLEDKSLDDLEEKN